MKNIQEVFDRIQEKKKEQRDMNAAYRDALRNSVEYKEVTEKIDTLRSRKKQIELSLFEQSAEKLDLLKLGIKADMETMSDIALNSLVNGETIKVVDGNNVSYDPVFSVRFRKAQ